MINHIALTKPALAMEKINHQPNKGLVQAKLSANKTPSCTSPVRPVPEASAHLRGCNVGFCSTQELNHFKLSLS